MNIEPGFLKRKVEALPPSEDEPRSRRKIWVIVGGAIAVALVAYWLFFRGGDAPPAAGPTLPRVTVVVPGRTQVENSISATGTFAARREMPVGIPGEGGRVAQVLVEPGDWVSAGQVLATIDRSVESQQSASLAATVQARRADAALAQANLDRAQKLVSRGFISKADVDRLTATRDAADADVRVAQAQLGEMGARIGRLSVRAPDAGLVLTRAIEPGQVVSSGSGTLFRVARRGEMELLARLAESDLARLKVGITAHVTPVGGTKSLTGQVWQMSPVIDPATRQGTVRIALAYDPVIRPGGFAAASISSGMIDAPQLPESAVQTDARGNYVYILDAENKVQRRDVEVGGVSDQGVTIKAGLTGQERVVRSAGAFLNPGEKVIPDLVKSR